MESKKILVLILVLFFSLFGQSLLAQMESQNFEILWDSINVGGREQLVSDNYLLYSTIGQSASGISSSTLFEESGGYQQLGNPIFKSQNWQFFFDYDRETPQEPSQEMNFAPAISKNTILKLRISINNVSDIDGQNIKMRLQFSTSSDFSSAYFVKEIGECTNEDVFCYADGAGQDNEILSQTLLSDSQIPATHNESGISTSTFSHPSSTVAEFEFTIKAVNIEEGQVYYLRAYDNTNLQEVLTNEGFSYPSLIGATQLSFSIEGLPAGTSTEGYTTTIDTFPTAISFSNLQPGISQIGAHRFSVSTNAPKGYQLLVFQEDNLKSQRGQTISPHPCSNEAPCSWDYWKSSNQSSAFGYHAGDDTLSDIGLGPSRFAPQDSFAGLESQPKEIGYHPIPTLNQIFDLIFRIETTNLQPAGEYFAEIEYLVVVNF